MKKSNHDAVIRYTRKLVTRSAPAKMVTSYDETPPLHPQQQAMQR